MDLNSPAAVALIAAVVSVVGTLLTVRATVQTNHNAAVQTQFQEIIKRRIEYYPKLWKIHIRYETNWTLSGQPKTREWAEQYAQELMDFNLEGGVFFSQPVYAKFYELRSDLYQAMEITQPGAEVPRDLTHKIRQSVYGGPGYGPGMSTHIKNDLGSYQSASLARVGKK
ncbi:hypothetical protein [Streptomyces spinosisporus]|uniref:Uncharacterized protein n=1 Tax=Streptomyces spinosisporus TaxID=2927582 RepID=A0ABS9XM49_9ACTN|nr:hypothetical protein [Streptomyces spinosisporus]MCI3243150.1 hypothetical protein [Streptomyces spinosisporus]